MPASRVVKRLAMVCALLLTLMHPHESASQSSAPQAEAYKKLDKSIECGVSTEGVFGDNNRFIQSTVKVKKLECRLAGAAEGKEVALKSDSAAAGFIETREVGRIKLVDDELYMRPSDQARLKRFLAKR